MISPHLGGHAAAADPLSTRRAFRKLGGLGRGLVAYNPRTSWDSDTALLPAHLASYRRQVREFSLSHLAPLALEIDADALDPAYHTTPGEWDPRLYRLAAQAGRAGLMSDLMPRPFGRGNPLAVSHNVWPQAIKTEEMARVCGGLMLLLNANTLGQAPLVLSGDTAIIRKFVLPALRETEHGRPHLFAYAITEPGAGSDVEEGHGANLYRPGLVARPAPDGKGWLLRGSKIFISGGDLAGTGSVFAALEGEGMESWTCFVVQAGTPGFRLARTELKMGMRASGNAELEFDDVYVPKQNIVGGLRQGWALNRATLNYSRLPVAAMGVGFAQAATDIATEFACTMRLGNKLLIDDQAVQLQIAQMIAETGAARSLIWHHAQAFTPRQDAASQAKFLCTDTAISVCYQAMDLLGNHCLPQAARLEKVFRDARLTQIFEGTNQINRLSVIEDMQEELLAHVPTR